MTRKRTLLSLLLVLVAAPMSVAATGSASAGGHRHRSYSPPFGFGFDHTRTPIKHLVVIFQENVSFDHYFGTYPNAANTDGQPFDAAPGHAGGRRAAPGDEPLAAAEPAAQHEPADDESRTPTLPQRLDSSADRAAGRCGRPAHLRPGPRLQRRAAGLRRRDDGPVRPERRDRQRHTPFGTALQPRDRHGLLRRQHRHGAVELRPALRDERQLVRDDVRAVTRRAPSTSSPATPADVDTATWPTARRYPPPTCPERRPHARRQRRLLAHQRRAAVLGRLLDPRRGRA